MKVIACSVLMLLTMCAVAGAAEPGARVFSAGLSGYNEVHFSGGPPATLRGAISTKASGTFTATLNSQARPLRFVSISGKQTPASVIEIRDTGRGT